VWCELYDMKNWHQKKDQLVWCKVYNIRNQKENIAKVEFGREERVGEVEH